MPRKRDLLSFVLHENERSERRIYAMNNKLGWSVKGIHVQCCFTLRPRSNVHRVPIEIKISDKTFPNLSGGLPQPGCQAWSLTTNAEDGYQRHVIIILAFQNQSVSFSPSISSFTIHGELYYSQHPYSSVGLPDNTVPTWRELPLIKIMELESILVSYAAVSVLMGTR